MPEKRGSRTPAERGLIEKIIVRAIEEAGGTSGDITITTEVLVNGTCVATIPGSSTATISYMGGAMEALTRLGYVPALEDAAGNKRNRRFYLAGLEFGYATFTTIEPTTKREIRRSKRRGPQEDIPASVLFSEE